MKKVTLLRNPTRVSDLNSFNDLYDEISDGWKLKAERLLHRRQKELRMKDAW
jgi:hypothetical protein